MGWTVSIINVNMARKAKVRTVEIFAPMSTLLSGPFAFLNPMFKTIKAVPEGRNMMNINVASLTTVHSLRAGCVHKFRIEGMENDTGIMSKGTITAM